MCLSSGVLSLALFHMTYPDILIYSHPINYCLLSDRPASLTSITISLLRFRSVFPIHHCMFQRSFKPICPKSRSHCAPSQFPLLYLSWLRPWGHAEGPTLSCWNISNWSCKQMKAKDGMTQPAAQDTCNQRGEKNRESLKDLHSVVLKSSFTPLLLPLSLSLLVLLALPPKYVLDLSYSS